MKTICLFDTSIASRNTGDQIIMDSVRNILSGIFRDGLFVSVATHESLFIPSHRLIRKSDIKIVCGTNLLSSNMPFYNQWKISILDGLFLKDIVLMGVGWWQYQGKPNLYTRVLLRKILSKDKIHSVRDNYTRKMLASIGIKNVVNTSCPTMWDLTENRIRKIPAVKADKVVFTLTSYRKEKTQDEKLINLLLQNYKRVYFWPQQPDDYIYFQSFDGKLIKRIEILAPNLDSFDDFLKKHKTDYVGTRLHAGIRALTFKKRALIIGVDNRSLEISRDTGLPVVQRGDLNSIEKWIKSKVQFSIKLPLKEISLFKNQFHLQ